MAGSSRHPSRGVLGVALLTLVSSCVTLHPGEPPLPIGAVLLATPAVYREWHLKTESCSGLSGHFSAVEWYVVPGVSSFATAKGPQAGMWALQGGTHRIIVAGKYLDHEMVIRHEILHALLARAGHPPEYFVTRCNLTWESWGGAIAASEPSRH